MIKREGDYLLIEDEAGVPPVTQEEVRREPESVFYTEGSVQ